MNSFLCICQYGHSRSVACARALHIRGYSAVAAGAETCGSAIRNGLALWADAIIIMQPAFMAAVPEQYRSKVRVLDVGPDKWSNPYHPELAALIDAQLNAWEL